MAEPGRGYYVYCVVSAGERPPLDGVSGVAPGATLELVGDEQLAALAQQVPLEEFGDEPLRRNFEDMDWLERTARAHQAVLDGVLDRASAIVPMRLCTIFEDEEHVRRMLARERGVLAGALDRVRDHSEWSVKVLADPGAVDAAARAHGAAEAPQPGGAGHAYVARKQRERTLRERSRQIVETAASDVHARLEQEADGATLLPPQRRELSGRSGEMVFNGAYLVHRSRIEAFTAAVDELRAIHGDAGLELELGGPWAPYNFVAAENPA